MARMIDFVVGKNPCPKCRAKGGDNGGNNYHHYGDGLGGHCFSCGFSIPSDAYKQEHGMYQDEVEDEEVSTKERITPEENEQIKTYTSNKSKGWRGIKDATNTAYGVRYSYDETTGDPDKQFVPTTISGELVGYKTRVFPKDFGNPIGLTGKDCQLVGQFRYKAGGKTVLIVGGEVDMLSAEQMLRESQEARGYGDYESFAVVAPSIGESGAYKQIQAQYEWLNSFSKIVVGLDQDAAGKEATEKILKVLPRGKVFVAEWSKKDPNEMLTSGRERQFVNEFWKAKPYTPSGIVSSDAIYTEIVERSKQAKLPFPPMLKGLNKMLAGGINYGYIVNILAGSGAGKSSLVNQCAVYWMVDCNEKVGVVSLEAEAAEFGENLLSFHMGKKISMIENHQEKIDFVGSKAAEDAAKELFTREDGTPRIYLLDDRGDYSKMQEKIEELIVSCGVRIIVIDVISDVFSGMTIPEIDLWMAWEKKLVKQYNVILIQVAHTRKGGTGEKSASQGKALTEESIIGSGTQYRSAGINIALQRDKTSEDFVERNTTAVHLLKSRATGMTGVACELFYDGDSHTLYDKQDWLEENAVDFSGNPTKKPFKEAA
jgi:archaellum biogenesis ATPase FlaH